MIGEDDRRVYHTRLNHYSSKIVLSPVPTYEEKRSQFPNLLNSEQEFSYYIKVNHGPVLANYEENRRRPIASLTKIITALVATEGFPSSQWDKLKIDIPELYIRK